VQDITITEGGGGTKIRKIIVYYIYQRPLRIVTNFWTSTSIHHLP